MGISYGAGNLDKFIGPLGLPLIMGAGDVIKPAAPNLAMLDPAFVYFASWYVLGLIGFWVSGYEPRGRSFDEIDAALVRPAPRSNERRRPSWADLAGSVTGKATRNGSSLAAAIVCRSTRICLA